MIEENEDLILEITGVIDLSNEVEQQLSITLDITSTIETLGEGGTNIPILREIASKFNLSEGTSSRKMIDQLKIANEAVTDNIKANLMQILDKLASIISKFGMYNKILSARLDNELKTGSLAKDFKLDDNKYKNLSTPFYKKNDLFQAIKRLVNISYQEIDGDSNIFENVVDAKLVKCISKIGYEVSGNTISKNNTTIKDQTLIDLGWSIDDFSKLATLMVSTLRNNTITGKRAIKTLKREITSGKDKDTINIIKTKITNVRKLILLTETITMNMSKKMLSVSSMLTTCQYYEKG